MRRGRDSNPWEPCDSSGFQDGVRPIANASNFRSSRMFTAFVVLTHPASSRLIPPHIDPLAVHGSGCAGRFTVGVGSGSARGADEGLWVLRLVETHFAPTGKLDPGHRAPSAVAIAGRARLSKAGWRSSRSSPTGNSALLFARVSSRCGGHAHFEVIAPARTRLTISSEMPSEPPLGPEPHHEGDAAERADDQGADRGQDLASATSAADGSRSTFR